MAVSAFCRGQIFVGFAFSWQLSLFAVKLFARCSLLLVGLLFFLRVVSVFPV